MAFELIYLKTVIQTALFKIVMIATANSPWNLTTSNDDYGGTV